MLAAVDFVIHAHYLHHLKTYLITPQVVFHGEKNVNVHHSFNEETYEKYNIEKYGYKALRRKNRRIRNEIHRFFTRTIPKRLAFRKRMKAEQIYIKQSFNDIQE